MHASHMKLVYIYVNNPHLQLFLEEAEDGARDDPTDAASIDAQHGYDVPVSRRRRLGRGQRRRLDAAEHRLRRRVQRQAGPIGAAIRSGSVHRRHH